jgi:hypothetical protein
MTARPHLHPIVPATATVKGCAFSTALKTPLVLCFMFGTLKHAAGCEFKISEEGKEPRKVSVEDREIERVFKNLTPKTASELIQKGSRATAERITLHERR